MSKTKNICNKCGAGIIFMQALTGTWTVHNSSDGSPHMCKAKVKKFTKDQIDELNRKVLEDTEHVRLQRDSDQSRRWRHDRHSVGLGL